MSALKLFEYMGCVENYIREENAIMKFGFVTPYSEEALKLAKNIGFDGLEIFNDYDSPVNFEKLDVDGLKAVKERFDQNAVSVLTACCSINLMDADPEKRQRNIDYMKNVIKNVKYLGTNIITTNTWGSLDVPAEESIPLFKESFSYIVKMAEDEGVKIALENCPHYVGFPLHVRNIGYSPEMMEALFYAVDSPALGIEYDPSHLVWLGIDYLRYLRQFSHKLFAIHAKDTEILEEGLYKYGIIGKQIGKESEWDAGWWRYRIPGWGQVKWQEIFKILYDISYDGCIIIEHEDPVFDGEMRPQGLKMGLDYLKQYIL